MNYSNATSFCEKDFNQFLVIYVFHCNKLAISYLSATMYLGKDTSSFPPHCSTTLVYRKWGAHQLNGSDNAITSYWVPFCSFFPGFGKEPNCTITTVINNTSEKTHLMQQLSVMRECISQHAHLQLSSETSWQLELCTSVWSSADQSSPSTALEVSERISNVQYFMTGT